MALFHSQTRRHVIKKFTAFFKMVPIKHILNSKATIFSNTIPVSSGGIRLPNGLQFDH